MRIQKIVYCLIACIGIQTIAIAQLKVGARFGVGIETNKVSEFSDIGFTAQLEVGYGITDQAEISVLYQNNTIPNYIGDNGGVLGNGTYINTWILNGRYYFVKRAISCYAGLGIGVSLNKEFPEVIGFIRRSNSFIDEEITRKYQATNFVVRPSIGCIFHTGSRNRGINLDISYLDSGEVGPYHINTITVSVGVLIGLTTRKQKKEK